MDSSQANTKEEIMEFAMRDEIFAAESISLEPCSQSLTVRLPDKFKHFNSKYFAIIPAWSEDIDLEKECLLL